MKAFFLKSFILTVLMQISMSCFAKIEFTSQICPLPSQNPDRAQAALEVFEKISEIRVNKSNEETPITILLGLQKSAQLPLKFAVQVLHAEIDLTSTEDVKSHVLCAFKPEASFDTPKNYIRSLKKQLFIVNNTADFGGQLLPGFKAIVGGIDSQAVIYIESTPHGFVFYDCEGDDGIRSVDVPKSSNKCPLLLSPMNFIPVSELLHNGAGLLPKIMVVLKAIAGASLIFLANSPDYGLIATAGQLTINISQPQPLNDLLDQSAVATMTNGMLEFAKRSRAIGDGQIPTVREKIPFAVLKSALINLLADIDKKMGKEADAIPLNNPNHYLMPGYLADLAYHKYQNERWREANEPTH